MLAHLVLCKVYGGPITVVHPCIVTCLAGSSNSTRRLLEVYLPVGRLILQPSVQFAADFSVMKMTRRVYRRRTRILRLLESKVP
jgi:hypothetical protein